MANDPLVYLKLQHGANYTDLPSGRRWTASAPIHPVPKARAAELLRETLPVYQGETSKTVRRFAAVPAPPPAEPKPAAPPALDEGVERSQEEIEAEIEAAAAGFSTAPTAEPASVRTPAPTSERSEAPGGRAPRQRLPRTPEGESSGS